jgi:hypothetical protein
MTVPFGAIRNLLIPRDQAAPRDATKVKPTREVRTIGPAYSGMPLPKPDPVRDVVRLGADLLSDVPALVDAGREAIKGNYGAALGGAALAALPFVPATTRKLGGVKPTQTDAFKKWFGNSQVVDDAGEPMVMYHGADTDIQAFDPNKTTDSAFWFSQNRDKIAKGESGAASTKHIIPAYLKANKLAGWDEYDRLTYDQLINEGYDGIKLDDDIVVFSPTQIKHATQNRGTFDPTNPDIRYAIGGGVGFGGLRPLFTGRDSTERKR